jgi:hypothetical protein
VRDITGISDRSLGAAGHTSDCAVHNERAYPAGLCNCGAEIPVTEEMRQAGAVALGYAPDHYNGGPQAILVYRAMAAKAPKPAFVVREERIEDSELLLTEAMKPGSVQWIGFDPAQGSGLKGWSTDADQQSRIAALEAETAALRDKLLTYARQWNEGNDRIAQLKALLNTRDSHIAELNSRLAENAKSETAADMKPPTPTKEFPAGALQPSQSDPRRIGSA